jgi:hypothetical protein
VNGWKETVHQRAQVWNGAWTGARAPPHRVDAGVYGGRGGGVRVGRGAGPELNWVWRGPHSTLTNLPAPSGSGILHNHDPTLDIYYTLTHCISGYKRLRATSTEDGAPASLAAGPSALPGSGGQRWAARSETTQKHGTSTVRYALREAIVMTRRHAVPRGVPPPSSSPPVVQPAPAGRWPLPATHITYRRTSAGSVQRRSIISLCLRFGRLLKGRRGGYCGFL